MDPRRNRIQSYIWDENDKIGTGITGNVFKGYCEDAQQTVAVKILNEDVTLEEENLQLWITLNHPNILKIFHSGKVTSGCFQGRTALVMEYCSEGDLKKMIQESYPKGLNDKDYILLLRGLCKGVEQLFQNHILHRDICSLNICCHVGENNEKIFKLIEFDMLKVENLMAKSSCDVYMAGSPHYWHPRIVDNFINTPKDDFNHERENDLWAIGVTMYEAATGCVPFETYNKQINIQELCIKLSNAFQCKTPGVVSMQETSNGKWSTKEKLPKDINLSKPLSKVITPMLAGMLEKEGRYMWTSKRFTNFCDGLFLYTTKRQKLVQKLQLAKNQVRELTEQVQTLSTFSLPPTQEMMDLTLTYLSRSSRQKPMLYTNSGQYEINWPQQGHDLWIRMLQKKSDDPCRLEFPPLILPRELDGAMIELSFGWDRTWELRGRITEECPYNNQWSSVKIAMHIQLFVGEEIKLAIHDTFKIKKLHYQHSLWSSLDSAFDTACSLPRALVKVYP